MHLIHRKTCRVCGSEKLTRVIDLGEQYLQGSFIKHDRERPALRKIPISLVRCDPMKDETACGLLQMEYSVPSEILYSSYWYQSGTNQTMREHLKQITDEAVSMSKNPKSMVLDIGCNDGTLLSFYPDDFIKYGIDPSNISVKSNQNIKFIRDTFPSQELLKELQGKKFNIITSVAMFYDLEDPVHFTSELKNILDENGLWIFELSYMPSMLRMNSYDTICHEHLEYYSLAVLEYIMKKAEMKIINAVLNDINGGSIRCYVTHRDNFIFKSNEFENNIRILHRDEFDIELDTDKPYSNFQDKINIHRDELSKLLKGIKGLNKTIHVYGASTKGNTILQWCGFDNRMIDYAADRNPEKHGAYTIGTNILIISEEKSREMKPDYYLVLPWHFRKEFLEREKEIIKSGTSLIFPLPEIEIIGQDLLPVNY